MGTIRGGPDLSFKLGDPHYCQKSLNSTADVVFVDNIGIPYMGTLTMPLLSLAGSEISQV